MELPNTAVARVIKQGLPDGMVVSKAGRAAINRAAAIFAVYLTSTCVPARRRARGRAPQQRRGAAAPARPRSPRPPPPLAARSANDICRDGKRSTVNATDVMRAVEEVELPEFSDLLRSSLQGAS